MKKSDIISLNFLFVVLDYLLLNITLLLILLFYHLTPYEYYELLLISNLSATVILVFFFNEHYYRNIRIYEAALRGLKKSLLISGLFTLLSLLYYQSLEFNHRFFLLFSVLYCSSLVFAKAILVYLAKVLRSRNFLVKSIVIAGYGPNTQELLDVFEMNKDWGYRLAGIFDDKATGPLINGRINNLKEFCKKNDIHELFCCLPYVNQDSVQEIIDFADNNFIKVWIVPDFAGFSYKSFRLEQFDHIPVIDITPIPLEKTVNSFLKRFFDIVFTVVILVLFLWWMLLLLGIIIRIESKGPIFFKQLRTGLGGKSFWCYKLRTMLVNPHSDKLQATKDDERITRFGAFLRKSSLDELPQFINVLKGDMSVVGPRPHMIAHTEKYTRIVEKYMFRHKIKPGITGLAQVKGYRGETEGRDYAMEGRVKLDRFYIQHWSFWLDIKIIILTTLNIFKGEENAY